jgi:hypothetical protein
LSETWRARRLTSSRSRPAFAISTGALLKGLMMGSRVSGIRTSSLRNGTIASSTYHLTGKDD